MKYQVLFSLKKCLRMLTAAVVIGALMVKLMFERNPRHIYGQCHDLFLHICTFL